MLLSELDILLNHQQNKLIFILNCTSSKTHYSHIASLVDKFVFLYSVEDLGGEEGATNI